MNIPLVASFVYLLFGMLTTLSLWSSLSDEIEAALEQEEEELQPALRVFLLVIFVMVWPAVVMEVARRR